MSPRTAQQFEEIRETSRNKIQQTALELFASEGYFNTSISRIAREAGVSKGLLYNYFEGKDELLKQIIYQGIDRLGQFFDPDGDGVLTRDELEYFIREFFEILEREQHYWKLYFTLFLQPAVLKLVEKRVAAMIHNYITMISNYFERQGFEDPEIESLFLGALLDGIGFHYLISPSTFPKERIQNKMIKMYCKTDPK